MKKLLFAALLTVAVAASAFAKDTNKISYTALRNFSSNFEQAKDVSWIIKNNFAKASFNLNGVMTEAFYDTNGELIGTSRNISLDELPVDAKRNFAKKYNGYTVKEAIRFEGAEETAYYISAENGAQSVILKVADGSSVSVFKKTDMK